MNLSIIIVNYKTPELLKNCLASVYRHTRNVDFEIIVVDNFSQDNSQMLIKEHFAAVKWIQIEYNAGFARANNEGIRKSGGNTVLLLNSDTLVTDNAIGNCYSAFISSSNVACGVQLLNVDGSPQISGNFFKPGGLNNLLPLPYTGKFLKWLGTLFNVQKPHIPDARSEQEVDWINGAYLMVKKSVIEKAGLMDEDFFLYAEEAEWCYRLKKFGRLAIYGQFRVIHLQGETSNATFKSQSKGYYNLYDRKGFQIMLSNFVRIRKQFGVFWFIVHLLSYTFTLPIFFLGTIVESVFTLKNPSPSLGRVGGFAVNLFKLWAYFRVIITNRPFFYKVL